MKHPILSIVVPVYNVEALLDRFLTSLAKQTVSKDQIEVLILDGGSTDRTLEIAKLYNVTVIPNPQKLAEPGVVLGFQKAKGELVMVLAVDNIFPKATAIQDLIEVFENKNITAAFPKHETAKDDSIYSRYINTFTDPFTHFVYGNAANARTFNRVYKTIQHTDSYDIYDFQSTSIYPLIALAQGFTIRKEYIQERIHNAFDDVLVIYDLIKKKKSIAYVYSVSLYHYTIQNFQDFVRKQRRAVENALVRNNAGISKRGIYLTRGQKMRMALFFPYALTIVIPLLQSVIQYVRTRNFIWLFHWYISFVSAVALLMGVVIIRLKNYNYSND